MGVVVGCSYDVECVVLLIGLWMVVGWDIFDGVNEWNLEIMVLFCDDYCQFQFGYMYYYWVMVKNESGCLVFFNVISVQYSEENQLLVVMLELVLIIMQDQGVEFMVNWQDDGLLL